MRALSEQFTRTIGLRTQGAHGQNCTLTLSSKRYPRPQKATGGEAFLFVGRGGGLGQSGFKV